MINLHRLTTHFNPSLPSPLHKHKTETGRRRVQARRFSDAVFVKYHGQRPREMRTTLNPRRVNWGSSPYSRAQLQPTYLFTRSNSIAPALQMRKPMMATRAMSPDTGDVRILDTRAHVHKISQPGVDA